MIGLEKSACLRAARIFHLGKRMSPFHIKAQVLRQSQLEPATALGIFDARATGASAPLERDDGRASGRWRQSDLKRAIAAAQQAGLDDYRVEITPDGTISIIVGAPDATARGPED
jgi:hypothetical protein